MKKMLFILVPCLLLGIAFASCKSTKESVPAQSAVIDGPVTTTPEEDVGNAK